MPSFFYSASEVLFQLHGGMVSHMQVLATPSSTVHSTWILTTEVLAACRDVASGADRHLDMGLQVVEAHPVFPYFLQKRLAIPTSGFSVTFFCYLFPYFFRGPLTFF